MLQQWKRILANWINCYFNDTSKDEKNLNIESLLSIISHLRENLNLDESKSSILEAHTLEDFICNKYPEFKFENGTVEAGNEEEVCLSASLLLFFVCVNSKNFDIKNAMCSKLSSEDQEIILKFSKCLMGCPVISVREVQAAITEACDQDIAAMELPRQYTVAETPPALRSLHSDVRRLNATLDAERFDRNYLQEELSRTHGRLERLSQEKEQYKQEILNLKAKISLCCGEQTDAKSAEPSADRTTKLTKQLQMLEQRLEETETRLEDVAYERDDFKEKIDKLKQERDKWLTESQQEHARVSELSDELDMERLNVQSLKDLLSELRQHNKLNGLDSSSLECDDPDGSMHSLAHNSSLCSEVCVNVVEVQLGEERAKITVLYQQIQTLQDQINELNRKSETEKKTLENTVAQRENEIFNLKHRINEEIEEKNVLKSHCDDEMTKLNNEINELEQKLKDNNDYSRSIIEKKMEEIQTIQEEKLSLLQSLNNETAKLENIIKDLKSELDSEKQAWSKMKEGFKNHAMKLNEKVLNRSNELIELQNSVFEKGEKIETLQIELKKENEAFNEIKNKYLNLEEENSAIKNELRYKSNEIQDLHIKIQHSNTVVEDLKMEIQQLNTSLESLNENCKTLEGVKEQLLDEVRNREAKIDQTLKDINHINEVFNKEKYKLCQDVDERNATVNSLQVQLQNEIEFKVGLQNELTQLQNAKTALTEENEKINTELAKLQIEIDDKDRTINAMDLYIQEEKKQNDQANKNILKMADDLASKEDDKKILNNKLESTNKCLQEEIQKNENNTEVANTKLRTEIAERETLQLQLNVLFTEKSNMEKELSEKCEEIMMLRNECGQLSQKVAENETQMKLLEQKFNDECKKSTDLHSKFVSDMSLVQTRVKNVQSTILEATITIELKIKEKGLLLQKLCKDLDIIKNIYEKTTYTLLATQDENKDLVSQLSEEKSLKENLEEEYQNLNSKIEEVTAKFKEEIIAKNSEINSLKVEIQSLFEAVNVKSECLKALEEKLHLETQIKNELSFDMEMEIKELKREIAELQSIKEKVEQHLRKEIEMKIEAIHALETAINENESDHAVAIKEKTIIIDILEQQVRDNILKFEDLRHHNEELRTSWDYFRAETKAAIKEKEDKIAHLNEMALTFEQKINEVEQEKSELYKRIVQTEVDLETLESEEKAVRDNLESEKEILMIENKVHCSEKEKLLVDNTMLLKELNDERSIRMIAEIGKKELVSEKEKLIEEKALLFQELTEARSSKKITEEEKSILLSEKIGIDQQLNNEIETTNSLLQAKDSLTQCLLDQKLAIEISEKEKELLIAEKDLLKERIIENEKGKSEENYTLNGQIDILQKDLTKQKEALIILDEEIRILNEEVDKQKSLNLNLMQENQNLLSESAKLKKDIINLNSAYNKLRSDRESLEITLRSDKSAMEIEKNNMAAKLELELINREEENKTLLEECEKLKELFQENKEEHDARIKEKEWLILDMKNAQNVLKAEKESLDQALSSEKSIRDQMQSERNALALKLELELINKEEENKILLEETEKLKAALVEERAVQDALLKEKHLIIEENNSIFTSLNVEKCARNEMETEKNDLIMKLKDLTDKLDQYEIICDEYSCNVAIKEQQANTFETACEQLKANYQYVQKMNTELSANFNENLNKLIHKVETENVGTDDLQKLIDSEKFDNMSLTEASHLVFNIADVLVSKVSLLNIALTEMQESLKQKVMHVFELQTEIKRLEQSVYENKIELTKQSETHIMAVNSKIKDIQILQQENKTLHHNLDDVKVQLEVKVHSLKEKLVENEIVTDKLKKSYECQIENLNVMITKLSNYLKEKTAELESLRKDKDLLQQSVGDSCKVIKTLEDDVKTEKQNIDKIMSDFEAERQILKNMLTVTESVMEDQKLSLNNIITEHIIAKDCLNVENNELKHLLKESESKCLAQEMAYRSLFSLLRLEKKGKDEVEKESEIVRDYLDEVISYISKERNANISVISALEFQEKVLHGDYEKMKNDLESSQKVNHEFKLSIHALEAELQKVLQEKSQVESEGQIISDKLAALLEEKCKVEKTLQEKTQNLTVAQLENRELKCKVNELLNDMEQEKKESIAKLEGFKVKMDSIVLEDKKKLAQLTNENQQLLSTIEENKTVITNLEQLIKHELEENHKLRDFNEHEKLITANKCSMLQDNQTRLEKELEERQSEIVALRKDIETLNCQVAMGEQDSKDKDGLISQLSKEKDAVISTISKELVEEKVIREKFEQELLAQKSLVTELRNCMEIRALKKENEQLIRAIGQQETFTALSQEKAVEKYTIQAEPRDHHQVDNSSSDNTHSSVESLKTITDLEKIIHDKNRTITTLQTDITYLKTLMAESETKLLDVNKELEVSKETCDQLSNQLKKIVYLKNEEIAELKKQVIKMSATENRASQIIKVSSKYQAMILKRIAEIKSNTVLKELTNFGNSNNCDNELRRSLNAGTITMEDLENFLDTTDRHLKRCSEKQIALQKERDRLTEVNRINESEIINLKKFLTELSVSFQTFSSVKDLYGNKLSRVLTVQRTVRREILSLDGRVTDATMCKLERGYGAAMQDLCECTMNLERWVERCISRTVSLEKIKQAFTSDSERSSLATPSFQNTGLEIQLGELDKSFQKLLEEVARAVKGEGAKESQASTVMEVRAEYEDKLNRMKAKMKDLFNEQMAVLKNKQREEIGLLERELQKTRDRMEDSKRAYENHIRDLTKELWSVGEKYLVKNDEAEWLRKKQRSGSLMSLQHVHSSGLVPPKEPPSRPSDAQSLRSLPVTDSKDKREGRGMHMSDEEGEVFDNRWLKELSTPRRDAPAGRRLSELKWRNSLCPPHLKSSYPAETQFAPVLDEEEIKAGALAPAGARAQRKEVGITAYKKPGPPTPSKQAGRLSATDSELRESLRVEHDPHAHSERKTSTPARFRAFLRFNKNDTNEGTPRTRRLSNIFRKK